MRKRLNIKNLGKLGSVQGCMLLKTRISCFLYFLLGVQKLDDVYILYVDFEMCLKLYIQMCDMCWERDHTKNLIEWFVGVGKWFFENVVCFVSLISAYTKNWKI